MGCERINNHLKGLQGTGVLPGQSNFNGDGGVKEMCGEAAESEGSLVAKDQQC